MRKYISKLFFILFISLLFIFWSVIANAEPIPVPSCIIINDIDAHKGVDGTDSEPDVNKNGGTIDNVHPGDKLKIEVELANICEKETNNEHEIEAIEATITLDEMADEGDQDEDIDFYDIKSGESDSQIATFNVPLDSYEGTYEMTIEVHGYDKVTNALYEVEPVKIIIIIEKEKDKLKFKTFTLIPSTISCTKKTQLTLKLLNIGLSDEDVQLVISSSELNIEEIELFELQEGDAEDDDTMYTKTYTFDVPSNAATGSYVITGKAYYNSDDEEEVETGSAILTIEECEPVSANFKVRVNAYDQCNKYYWISPVLVNIYKNTMINEDNQIVISEDMKLVTSSIISEFGENIPFILEPGMYAIEAIKNGFKNRVVYYILEQGYNIPLSITMNPMIEPICEMSNKAMANKQSVNEEKRKIKREMIKSNVNNKIEDGPRISLNRIPETRDNNHRTLGLFKSS